MRFKKYIALILTIAVLGTASLAGCGTGTSSQISSAAIEQGGAAIVSSTFRGTVTAVDGNTITLSLADSSDSGKSNKEGADSESGEKTTDSAFDKKADDSKSDNKTANFESGNKAEDSEFNNNRADSESNDVHQGADSNGEKPDGAPDGKKPDGAPNGKMNHKMEESKLQTDSSGSISDGQAILTGEDTVVLTVSDDSVISAFPAGMGGPGSKAGKAGKGGPDGDGQTPPDMTDGDQGESKDTKDADASIEVGDTITVTVDENGVITTILIGGMHGGPGGMGGTQGGPGASGQDGVDSYTAANEFTTDTSQSGQTYQSTGTDEEAVLVSEGAQVTLSDSTISRDSNDSTGGDQSSFYGVGAAALVTDGTLTLDGADISTDAAGGAGVFAYGDGTAYVNNARIRTSQGTSGGLHAAGGGRLYAWNCDVETEGASSAAIRSDRGGGTMVIDGGSYTANGSGSPAVYCTADITVNEASLTATGSEGVCIEGLNTLRLYDTDLTCNMPDDDQNDTTWSVILYQSMSGDSQEGNSTFSMTGGSIHSQNGGLFYSTNTESTFYLNHVDIETDEDDAFFLQVTGNANKRGWGNTGSNGADTNFTADSQTMEGDVIYDSISNLDFYMENGSVLTGAFVDDESWAGDGGDGTCSLYISSDSKWIVTGDSTVTNLYCEGTITDAAGNAVTIKDQNGKTLAEGTSAYTITVTNYDRSADFSGAASAEEYTAAENPF